MEELEREEFSRIFPQTWIFRDFLSEEQRSALVVGVRAAQHFVLRVYEPKKTGA